MSSSSSLSSCHYYGHEYHYSFMKSFFPSISRFLLSYKNFFLTKLIFPKYIFENNNNDDDNIACYYESYCHTSNDVLFHIQHPILWCQAIIGMYVGFYYAHALFYPAYRKQQTKTYHPKERNDHPMDHIHEILSSIHYYWYLAFLSYGLMNAVALPYHCYCVAITSPQATATSHILWSLDHYFTGLSCWSMIMSCLHYLQYVLYPTIRYQKIQLLSYQQKQREQEQQQHQAEEKENESNRANHSAEHNNHHGQLSLLCSSSSSLSMWWTYRAIAVIGLIIPMLAYYYYHITILLEGWYVGMMFTCGLLFLLPTMFIYHYEEYQYQKQQQQQQVSSSSSSAAATTQQPNVATITTSILLLLYRRFDYMIPFTIGSIIMLQGIFLDGPICYQFAMYSYPTPTTWYHVLLRDVCLNGTIGFIGSNIAFYGLIVWYRYYHNDGYIQHLYQRYQNQYRNDSIITPEMTSASSNNNNEKKNQ